MLPSVAATPTRFTFTFAELSPVPADRVLRVLPAPSLALPGGADLVAAEPRPRWMPRLLPVFRSREPMRIDVLSGAAPPFAARLRSALCAIYASAGAQAGLSVVAWAGGLGVGGPAIDGLPEAAHAVVVAAALERGSVAAAAELLRGLPADRAWLALEGDVPAADAALGVDALRSRLEEGRVVRVPLLGRRELAALGLGREPALVRRGTGLGYLALAAGCARAYLDQQK